MPAPAVYVIAIIGTVGAAIAFKEFVYDPHLGPAIGRWKRDFFAVREERKRKRVAMLHSAGGNGGDAQMKERIGSSVSAPENSFQGESNSAQSAWGSQPARFSLSRDGLLTGCPGSNDGASQGKEPTHTSIELDNLVARELREWRNELSASSGQDLRQRKTGSGHEAMEESVHSIPSSTKRTHVLYNSGSASPATPPNAMQPLLTPVTPPMTPIAGKPQPPRQSPPLTFTSPPRARSPSSLSGSVNSSHSPLLRYPLQGQPVPDIQICGSQDKPLPPISNVHSSLFSPLIDLSPAQPSLPPPVVSPQLQSSPFSQHVPSLSQSYPQELDAEHGLELLSPPSSRADSPFSMADVSPGPRSPDRILDLRDGPTSVISTGFIQNDSLPPLEMDLGNESFDTLSPLMSHLQPMSNFEVTSPNTTSGSSLQQHTSSMTTLASANTLPFHLLTSEPLHLQAATPQSVTNSTRSTTYMSFTSGDDDDDDTPLAVRRASLCSTGPALQSQGLGLTFVVSSHRTVPAVRSPPKSPFNLNDSDLSDLDWMSDYAPSEAGGSVSIDGLSGSEFGGNDEMGVGRRDEMRSRILHPSATGYESDGESNASWSVAGESDVSDAG